MTMKLIITKNNISYVGIVQKDKIHSVVRQAHAANMLGNLSTFLESNNFTQIEVDDYPCTEAHYVYESDDEKILIIDPDVTSKRVVDTFTFLLEHKKPEVYTVSPDGTKKLYGVNLVDSWCTSENKI